jgi:hypothetical protein
VLPERVLPCLATNQLIRWAWLPIVCVAGIGLFVWSAWPSSTNRQLRQTFETLQRSPVPAYVIRPQEERETHAEVSSDGYVFRLVRPDDGDIHVSGSRRASAGGMANTRQATWSVDGATYTLSVPEHYSDDAVRDTRNGLKRVDVATREAFGFGWDTPLLYLFYLPLMGGFVCLTCWFVWQQLRS